MNKIFNKLDISKSKNRKLSRQELLAAFFILFISLYVNKKVIDFRIDQVMILKLFILIAVSLSIVELLVRGRIDWHKSRANTPILLFILVMTISLFRSDFFRISLNDYITFLFYFILYFFIRNNITDKIELKSFIKIFYLISFIVSLYTLIQYYGYDPYLKGLPYLSSTIGQKNWISNYLVMIFPIIFSYFLLENSKRKKIVFIILLSIIYTNLVICQSRGIWISIALTTILAIYIIFKFNILTIFQENKRWLTSLLIIFLIITTIYSTENPLNKSAITVTERAISTFNEKDPSINTRMLIWRTTFEMIKDYPLLGIGIGTFRINYLNYQAKYLKDNPDYLKYYATAGEAHNEYLQMSAELGIVGLGVFLSILFIFYSSILNYLEKKINNKDKIIVFGLLMGITCFLFHSLFSFPLRVPALGLTFFIIIGLTLSYIKNISSLKYQMNVIIKKEIFKNKKIKIFCIILVLFFMIFAIDSLVIRPYLSEIYYFKGIKDSGIKDYNASLYNLDYATKLNPYNGRILHALGATYGNLNIFGKTEECLQKAKKYINDVTTFYDLGLLYSKEGLYKRAEEEFKHAIYLDPKCYKAYYELGKLYFSQEDYDGAIEQCKNLLEIESKFNNRYIILYDLGILHQKKKMPNEALEYFLQALKLVPEGDPIEKEIEEEISKIYKSKLEK